MREAKPTHFGVINEDLFSLRSPRAIDGDEQETLKDAFKEARKQIEDGADEVSIVRCRYSDKHDGWFEVVGAGSIMIDATSARGTGWFDEEEGMS